MVQTVKTELLGLDFALGVIKQGWERMDRSPKKVDKVKLGWLSACNHAIMRGQVSLILHSTSSCLLSPSLYVPLYDLLKGRGPSINKTPVSVARI